MEQGLRPFLEALEAECSEEVVYIREEVDPRFQVTALALELERQGRFPVLIFERVKGHPMPLLTNLMSSRSRFSRAMGVGEGELLEEYGKRIGNYIPPRTLGSAPFRGRFFSGERLDLGLLPLLTHFPSDGAPYITAGLLVARDPDTGVETAGYHRLMLKGRDTLGVSLHSRRRLWNYARRAEERGEPLPVAVAIGVHPLISLGSQALLPPGVGAFQAMGGLFGEPLEVAETAELGLKVPAWAEIVIEGEILAGSREDEGPFGEFTGYTSSRSTRHLLRARAFSMREDALYQSICPGLSAEHCQLLSLPREVEILRALRRSLPEVSAVHVPLSGCGSFSCYFSFKPSAPGQARQALLTVFSVDHYLRLAVAVDDDVDVFNEREVLWAINTRCDFTRDLLLLPETMGTLLDPTATQDALTSKVGIDATKPLGPFAERLTLDESAQRWARELLGRLGRE
ncbi:MAG: UbiD family decarboxylase [Nitrospinota bacterium]